jgi:hypothetical protein
MKTKADNFCKATRPREKNMKDQKQRLKVGQCTKKKCYMYKRNIEARLQNHF